MQNTYAKLDLWLARPDLWRKHDMVTGYLHIWKNEIWFKMQTHIQIQMKGQSKGMVYAL